MTGFVEHDVQVTLLVTTTHEDIDTALVRSGIREGALIGEALITDVSIYSPDAVLYGDADVMVDGPLGHPEAS